MLQDHSAAACWGCAPSFVPFHATCSRVSSIISLHASLQTLCGGVVQCVCSSEHPCAPGLALWYPSSNNLKSSNVNTRPDVVLFVVCLVCTLLRWQLPAPGVGVVLVRAVGSSDAGGAAPYAVVCGCGWVAEQPPVVFLFMCTSRPFFSSSNRA